jgi:disulfide bond formation protein DsbB
MKFYKKFGLYFAWLFAIISTSGSLYLSEVKHFIPCNLCWFQRICMYPLVIILGIACYSNDKKVIKYALPLPIIGGCISIWHILEQKVPGFADILPCNTGIPCSGDYLNWFGFITIPMLALLGFILIIISLLVSNKE